MSTPAHPVTIAPWERLVLAAFAIALVVLSLWSTTVWVLLSGLALDRACTGTVLAGAAIAGLLAVVVGLFWTLAVSVAYSATWARRIHGRGWLVGPGICLAVAAYWVASSATTPFPDPLPTAGECSVYD